MQVLAIPISLFLLGDGGGDGDGDGGGEPSDDGEEGLLSHIDVISGIPITSDRAGGGTPDLSHLKTRFP